MSTPARLLCLLALCPLLLWAAACSNGSSPTFPDGPAVLQGTVEHQGSSEHDFTMDKDGLFEVRLSDVKLLLVDISQTTPASLTFGFGLGQRVDGSNCTLTTNFVLLEGDKATYRLESGTYCLTVFDPGVFPEDALLGYTLEIQISI